MAASVRASVTAESKGQPSRESGTVSFPDDKRAVIGIQGQQGPRTVMAPPPHSRDMVQV